KIRTFMWNSTAPPPISLKTLTQPIDKGGKKLLDLPARNKAIQLTWLKLYLSLGNNCPAWALLADEILRTNIINAHSNLEQNARTNIFLQNWRPNINKIPQDLKDMLKAAKEFKVKLELLQPTQEIKNSLPIWQHTQANDLLRLEYNIKESKCLRNKHNILTVGQTKNLTQRITRA